MRIARFAALGIASLVLVGVFYVVIPSDFVLRRWNVATAYVALGWLALTLLLGPWNVLLRRSNPVSIDTRRDIGIWAALLGVIHTVIGLQVHMQGKFWLYFVYPSSESHPFPLRTDGMGLANYTGLASTLILLFLLALSNDASLRRLGPVKWKALQRWNYAAFGLMALHALTYQIMEKRILPVVTVFVGIVVTVVATQLAGFVSRRKQTS